MAILQVARHCHRISASFTFFYIRFIPLFFLLAIVSPIQMSTTVEYPFCTSCSHSFKCIFISLFVRICHLRVRSHLHLPSLAWPFMHSSSALSTYLFGFRLACNPSNASPHFSLVRTENTYTHKRTATGSIGFGVAESPENQIDAATLS